MVNNLNIHENDAEILESVRLKVPKELLGIPKVFNLILYCLIDWAIIMISWIAMYFSNIWLYPIWCLIIATQFHSLGVVIHDATHLRFHKKSLGLRIVEILAGYPMGTTLDAMRYHHLRHHRNNGLPNDPYFVTILNEKAGIFYLVWRYVILAPWWAMRSVFGLFSLLIPEMRTHYAKIFLQDRSNKDLTNSVEVITCAREELGHIIFQILIFSLAINKPILILSYYFIPITLTGLLAGYRVLSEHNYIPAMDRSVKTLFLTTNDHDLGFFRQFLFAPRNIGYHLVHHLHPQVALENLSRLHNWYSMQYPKLYPSPVKQGKMNNVQIEMTS